MFYLSRTHQNLSNQAKTHMEVHFLPILPIGMLKSSNEPIKKPQKRNEPNKVLEKEDEPNMFSKEEDEPMKTTKETKTPKRIARQVLKHVYGVQMDMEMEEIDGEERRLMWLQLLVDEHAT